MATPSDMLGPYGFRGLTDFPKNYGDAVQAENLEWQGDWVQTRKGSTLIHTLTFASDKILFQREFRGRTNFQIHVVVALSTTDTESYRVQIFRSGEDTLLADFSVPFANGRPSYVEYEGRLLLFLPATTDGQFTVWEIFTEAPYYQPLVMDDFPHAGGDTGVYRPVDDPIRGIFGVPYMDRIFAVQDSDPWNVWYSDHDNYRGWPYENFFSPFGDSNEPLTGLAIFNQQIVSFTRTKISVTKFSGKGLEESRPLKLTTGAICQQAIANIGNELVFLSDDGLLSMDLSGNVTDTLGAAINSKTLADLKDGFPEASLTYMAAKRQLWLALPAANKLFVLDLRTGNWSTISWTNHDNRNRLWSLGTAKDNGVEYPTVSYTTDAHVGVIACYNGTAYSDQHPDGASCYRSQWISHSTPFVGQSLFRYFNTVWLTLKDCGSRSLRLLWSTKGQVFGGHTTLEQFVDFPATAPWPMTRVGSAVVGAGTFCAPYLGEQDWEKSIALRGVVRGRWIQLALVGLFSDDRTYTLGWAAKRWRILTRVKSTNREY